jgi:type VI protein secretion system component Hcp
MSRYLASDIDQSTRAKDELKDDELGQISGGDGVVNHSEFSFVKLLDVSTPKIDYK